ncbi:MAG TPA: DUF5916 domain-containing protein [Gemmatimonadales bacterium]|nr:DUF5916 domain-containing protein [Gemmatimonadales bacterium]
MTRSSILAATAALVLWLSAPSLHAQNVHSVPGPELRAVPLQERIQLDGRLDENVWGTAPPATDFRQTQPNDGEPATQRTEVRFAYDDEALYVGARMFDDRGAAGVVTRLVRRDGDISSDYVQVIVDPYHDHVGRLFFLVNPSGVRNDANGLGGGGDDSWDPVWDVKTTIDSLGWTAEMRIPFSQLRYPETSSEQTWGLQVWRQVNRLNELSMWSWWSRTESGGPARFGHLSGLTITRSPGRAELLPYVVGRSANVPVSDAADPFQDPHATDARAGLDARVLLTSNLTLTATVNPDFGQVEVDPAVVNLSAFETFFQERRPFFVEGAGYFGFGGLNCFFCSNVSSLGMFYTRRIGRAPQGGANAGNAGPYADVPDNTTILGAAKLTGRTRSGWSVGLLDAVTRREQAAVALGDGSRTSVTVEPFTNYFVGRVGRDLRGGATLIRAIATSVVRDLDEPFFRDRLTRRAESFGLATDTWFNNRNYRLMAQVAGTQATGDPAAMLRLQRSSARYFQRPDRQHGGNGFLSDAFDSTLTVLRGLGGYARFAREQGNVLWEVSTNVRTPGFENNDIAFLSRADYWWMSANVLPQWTRPTSWYRHLMFIVGAQQQYNFDGDLTDRQLHLFTYWQPTNYWDVNAFWIHRPRVLDDRLSRGGPVLKRPGGDFWSTFISTDSRKPVVANLNVNLGCATDDTCDRNISTNLTFRPLSNLSFSMGPSVGRDESTLQYVTSVADSTATTFFGRRYVFADLVQNTVSMDTRVNVTFSPNLTLELFLQPLIASGDYTRYKEFAAPRSDQQMVYGQDAGTVLVTPGERATYTIDPDGAGPATTFDLTDPSFTFRSLRGNAVLRWEYLPGSTLFLVWTRSSASELARGNIALGQDARALFRGPAENIFLVKLNYWLGI